MRAIDPTTRPPFDRIAEWTPSALRGVVVRMSDGELLHVGTTPNRESALVLARTVIAEIEASRGGWALVGGRPLCTDSIISVDVLATSS